MADDERCSPVDGGGSASSRRRQQLHTRVAVTGVSQTGAIIHHKAMWRWLRPVTDNIAETETL
ncbi:hypothetical protein EYF80_023985 [Liparis tanakae]|uniref:Uncharacterized protein n=1 Tax=Liparis tanakae TaxID=230148 RepID=A0A4Z2HLG0_9TELE|nr:hypothetical protein EYF80_023985 [Liparis tanakae]